MQVLASGGSSHKAGRSLLELCVSLVAWKVTASRTRDAYVDSYCMETWCHRALPFGSGDDTVPHTFGRRKSNHLYISCKEGTCINVTAVPPMLPLSPHMYSLGWWCQSGDSGSGRGHTRCACMGGVSRDRAPSTASAGPSLPGRTLVQSNMAGPAPCLAAGITAGRTLPGVVHTCLYAPTQGYTHTCIYIHVYVCIQLWWRGFSTSYQLPSSAGISWTLGAATAA